MVAVMTDRTAILTGAGSGIGAAIASELARAGGACRWTVAELIHPSGWCCASLTSPVIA